MIDSPIIAAISEQTGQSHSVGIVVLQPLLTLQRVADGRLQSCGQLDYFFARVPPPIAAKNNDSAGVVNQFPRAGSDRNPTGAKQAPKGC